MSCGDTYPKGGCVSGIERSVEWSTKIGHTHRRQYTQQQQLIDPGSFDQQFGFDAKIDLSAAFNALSQASGSSASAAPTASADTPKPNDCSLQVSFAQAFTDMARIMLPALVVLASICLRLM